MLDLLLGVEEGGLDGIGVDERLATGVAVGAILEKLRLSERWPS